jgi:hypothetical protein
VSGTTSSATSRTITLVGVTGASTWAGKSITITGGNNYTPGAYYAISAGSTTVSLDRPPATGAASGLIAELGASITPYQWKDPSSDARRPMHSEIHIRHVAGVDGAGFKMLNHNTQVTKKTSQVISIDFRTGATPTSRLLVPEFTQVSRTKVTGEFWDGEDPEYYGTNCAMGETDPHKCERDFLAMGAATGGLTLSSIVVSGNAGTLNCTPQCGFTEGEVFAITGVPNSSHLNMVAIVDCAVACTTASTAVRFLWTGDLISGGSYTDSAIRVRKGRKERKYWVDHNTPYLIHARMLPEWKIRTHSVIAPYEQGYRRSNHGKIASINATAGYPGYAPGIATFGTDDDLTRNMSLPFRDWAEVGVLEMPNVLWVQKWELGGSEIFFCDSCPGGGGGIKGHRHIPWNWTESDTRPRPFMAGYPDLNYGKPPTVYSRPTQATLGDPSSWVDPDRTQVACHPGTVPAADTVSPVGLPCTPATNLGRHGWEMDNTHHPSWAHLAYLIKAEPDYLDDMHSHAQYGIGSNYSERFGHSWAKPITSNDQPYRAVSWTVRDIMFGVLLSPNVPLFGSAYRPVESDYYNKMLYDAVYDQEALQNIQDGAYWTHYPEQATSSCVGITDRTVSVWSHTRCMVLGETLANTNTLGWAALKADFDCSETAYISCAGRAHQQQYMPGFSGRLWSFMEFAGMTHFAKPYEKLSRLLINLVLNTKVNPYLTQTNHSPSRGSDGLFIQDLAQYHLGYAATWTHTDGTQRTRNLTNWDYTAGSQNSNIGYSTQAWNLMAVLEGKSGDGIDGCDATCTARRAWEWYNSAYTILPSADLDHNPKFNIIPRNWIENISFNGAGLLTYTAKSADPCYLKTSVSAFTDSLDTGSTSDGSTIVGPRTVDISALISGGQNHVMITCGQRVPGLAAGTSRATFELEPSPTSSIRGTLTIKGNVTIR